MIEQKNKDIIQKKLDTKEEAYKSFLLNTSNDEDKRTEG